MGKLAQQFGTVYPVIELGPGTGSTTKYLPKDTISVELDSMFYDHLRVNFPDRNIVNMDALDYLSDLKNPVNIVSSIPLINNPNAKKIRVLFADLRDQGKIHNLITFSYGRKSPLVDCGFKNGCKAKTVYWNFPPASVWHYW